jgi:phage shock protein PspC (stress-responsive transcriptional regulator)
LRRSSTDRVAAGVSGGLGEYFNLDPVLFRVLFAVSAFFGGAGVVLYLLAWIAIPDQHTDEAPLDRFTGTLRRYRIPFWLVATIAVILGWVALFSWWAPRSAGALVIALVILAIVLSRRQFRPNGSTPGQYAPGQYTPGQYAPGQYAPGQYVSGPTLSPDAPAAAYSGAFPGTDTPPAAEVWLPGTRTWIQESREAARIRRRRSAPITWTTLGVLAVTMAALGVADAVGGIVLPTYFWVAGGILLTGLIVGIALRRAPLAMNFLLVPVLLGLLAFGGSRASLHDGGGTNTWTPQSSADLAGQYRLGFGQLTLDLRSMGTLSSPRTVDITVAAGQVRLLLPNSLNAVVQSHVHIGAVRVDDDDRSPGPNDSGGFNYTHYVAAPAQATGAQLTLDVHLTDGAVTVDHS